MHHYSGPVCIMMGSNLGERLFFLEEAEKKIAAEAGDIMAGSSLYETSAWGNMKQPSFLNKVIIINTGLSPVDLLNKLLEIEISLGRKRKKKWDPRTIDLDILFYENQIINNDFITIPHPRIAERKFSLIPLAELIPGFKHPVLAKNMMQLLAECTDKLPVNKVIQITHKHE